MRNGWCTEPLVLITCLIIRFASSASPTKSEEDTIDNVYDEFITTVNVLTCPPNLWTEEGERNFTLSLAYYINYFCHSRKPEDRRRCAPADPASNYSFFAAFEDVVFIGNYPKRTYLYWELKFVVFWRHCAYSACSSDVKPFVGKGIVAEVLHLYAPSIGSECGFTIVNFDTGEPFDDTLRLINIFVLPCGLAVILIMAGVVWFAVYLEKIARRKNDEIRQEIILKKRELAKKRMETNRREKRREVPDVFETGLEFRLKPSPKISPVISKPHRFKPLVADTNGASRHTRLSIGSNAHETLPNSVPEKLLTKDPHTEESDRKISKTEEHPHKNAKRNAALKTQKRPILDNRFPKKINIWRGGNILLRPLGKRAADNGGAAPNQYL